MKIAIIGSPGSGKSTLSLKLHKIFNLPLYHIDQYFWKPGWQRPDREEFRIIHNNLCDKSEWIIEGMAVSHFGYRLARVDMIIFLDIPLYICLYRIFKRAFTNFGKVCFSSAPGCPEGFPSWEFLTYVWNFNRKQKKEVEVMMQQLQPAKEIFVIKNQREIDNLIDYFNKYSNSL